MYIHQKPVDHEIHRPKTQTKNYRPNTTPGGLLSFRKLPFISLSSVIMGKPKPQLDPPLSFYSQVTFSLQIPLVWVLFHWKNNKTP